MFQLNEKQEFQQNSFFFLVILIFAMSQQEERKYNQLISFWKNATHDKAHLKRCASTEMFPQHCFNDTFCVNVWLPWHLWYFIPKWIKTKGIKGKCMYACVGALYLIQYFCSKFPVKWEMFYQFHFEKMWPMIVLTWKGAHLLKCFTTILLLTLFVWFFLCDCIDVYDISYQNE